MASPMMRSHCFPRLPRGWFTCHRWRQLPLPECWYWHESKQAGSGGFWRRFSGEKKQSTLHLIGADKYSLKSSSEPSPAVCNLVISIISLSCSNLFSDFKSLLLVFTFPLPLRAWGHCHDRHLSNFMSRCSKPKPKRQIPWIEKCSNKGMIEVVSEGFYHKFIIITPDHHHHHNHHHHLHHHHLVPPWQLCKDASHPLCPPSPL